MEPIYNQTAMEAIDTTIELWQWMHKTGSFFKSKWPGWEMIGEMQSSCPLCQHAGENRPDDAARCTACLYYRFFSRSCMGDGSSYQAWCRAKTILGNKRAAGRFLKELYQLREAYLDTERLG